MLAHSLAMHLSVPISVTPNDLSASSWSQHGARLEKDSGPGCPSSMLLTEPLLLPPDSGLSVLSAAGTAHAHLNLLSLTVPLYAGDISWLGLRELKLPPGTVLSQHCRSRCTNSSAP